RTCRGYSKSTAAAVERRFAAVCGCRFARSARPCSPRYTAEMRTIYLAVSLSLLTACTQAQTAAPPAPAATGPAESEIKEGPLKAHLRLLSHDLFEGRAPSTRGGTL